ncbi:MAG TPA: hydroxyisourate hydrolase [Candidatus Limnocylindrales bacterium]|nr:hydroxyisourate hydrolase [Candidatus Limnocylindrales bacterium]
MAEPDFTISTHVLDLETGQPASGFPVALFRLAEDGSPMLLAEAETDRDGRVRGLLSGELTAGSYQLVFDVAAYYDADDQDAPFFENMVVGFRIDDPERSYHVPLLLSPFGLSTYRGS